jgi:hypothetical protein
LAAVKTAKNNFPIHFLKKVDPRILNENMILFLLANLTGIIGGAFVLVVLQPPMDFFYLLPSFILLGVIAANLVLVLIIELTKEPDAKTMREVPKQAG